MRSMPTRALRITALACGAAGTLFWLWTFHFISQLPEGDGTGFQWIAAMPLTGIFLCCALPAILLAPSSRLTPLAAGLGVVGVVLFALLWMQLLNEFQTAPG